mmetsp:Transcript_13350/g.38321  ORF Transcript_13350/g.38321 Transcript_13350/m.38321 type:complete len:170 (-) Transcript_13350:111-620(-)
MTVRVFVVAFAALAAVGRAQDFAAAAALNAEFEGGSAALSLIQGRAAKIVKKRAAAPAAPAGMRPGVPVGALLEDDTLGLGAGGLGGVSLMQEKQSRIKATSGACDMPPESKKGGAPRPASGLEAALFAAAQDGVEDGIAALSLLQGSRSRLDVAPPQPRMSAERPPRK